MKYLPSSLSRMRMRYDRMRASLLLVLVIGQLLCHFVCDLIHYPDSLRACPSLLVVLMIGQLLCLLCASLSVIQILCVCACPSPFALPLALANALRYHVRYQEIMKLSSSLLLG